MSRRPSNRAFNTTADIKTPTVAQDATGVWVPSGSTTDLSDVRCRLIPATNRESQRLLGETVEAEWILLTDAVMEDGTAVTWTTTDEVTIDDTTYKFVGPPADQGGQGQVLAGPLKPLGAAR